jgi:type IV pilus assembly protein PilX
MHSITIKSSKPAPHGRQRGAILVTSLLLLLVLTVLGVAMMRMTGMQERMAGNTRDMGLAFQGAEAGLRDGEGWLRLQGVQPGSSAALPDCGNAGICQRFGAGNVPVLPLDIEDQAKSWWNTNARVLADAIDDLEQQPRYVIEEAGFVRDSLLFDETAGRDFYRLTGQSSGGSGLANTVLQSTYARRF